MLAYVDTSFIVAIAFGESSATKCRRELLKATRVLSCTLLEAELLSVASRHGVPFSSLAGFLAPIDWILPPQRLSEELDRVFQHGYLRGADAFHLATGLWFAGSKISKLTFLTLDVRQRTIAKELGFRAPQIG